MATEAAQLIGPALEKICEHAGGRKLVKLRHEAKVHPGAALLSCWLPQRVAVLMTSRHAVDAQQAG